MSDTPPLAPLPPRSDLNWLKNRAKEELAKLRAADPAARLAAAQRNIANRYGFASWRKLKAHIDALGDDGEAIVQAVGNGDAAAISAILDRHPQLVNATTNRDQRILPSDTRAMRILHVAVAENQIAVAKLLIERGADLNARNADGRLAIHDCFELGRGEIYHLLLDAGARLDVIAAAAWNHLDVLREILQRDPAAANDMTTHLSPLGWVGFHPRRAAAARILLQRGAIVDRPPYDASALHPTAQVANTPVLRVLLAHGANPNFRNAQGDTLLHLAVRSRITEDPLEYIQTLLAAGCDPAARNHSGQSALDEAIAMHDKQVEEYATRAVIGKKRLGQVIELLRRITPTAHASPSSQPPGLEVVKAFTEALRGNVPLVRKMLDEHPMLAAATLEGFPMLYWAAGDGPPEMIRLLIERGADPNYRGADSLHTPLSWGVTNDRMDICNALIDGGAKADLWCAAGLGWIVNVRGYFDEQGNVRPGTSFTGSSRRRADGSRITEVSLIPVEIVSDALYIACRNGHTEVALYLLERGADPNFRAFMGATCFHWAYFGGGDPPLVAAMLAHGGDAAANYAERRCTPRAFGVLVTAGWGWKSKLQRILDIDPSLANHFEGGSTPLHEAARNGHAEAVKLLLARGADRDRRDADGKTARDRAAEAKHAAIVELLAG